MLTPPVGTLQRPSDAEGRAAKSREGTHPYLEEEALLYLLSEEEVATPAVKLSVLQGALTFVH